MGQRHLAPQKRLLGGKIGPLIAHIAPIPRSFKAIEGRMLGQQRGKNILSEIRRTRSGNHIQHLGL